MLKVCVLVCDWLTDLGERHRQLADHLIELDRVRAVRARLRHLGVLAPFSVWPDCADHLGDHRLVREAVAGDLHDRRRTGSSRSGFTHVATFVLRPR